LGEFGEFLLPEYTKFVPKVWLKQAGVMVHLSHINIRHRLTQVIVLIVLMLITTLWAQVARAESEWPGRRSRFDKPKYRAKVHREAGRVCHILRKKRKDSGHSHSLFASLKHKTNKQAMAEAD
jgi:hypothetical protein